MNLLSLDFRYSFKKKKKKRLKKFEKSRYYKLTNIILSHFIISLTLCLSIITIIAMFFTGCTGLGFFIKYNHTS